MFARAQIAQGLGIGIFCGWFPIVRDRKHRLVHDSGPNGVIQSIEQPHRRRRVLWRPRRWIKHVSVQDIGTDKAGLGAALNAHDDVCATKHSTMFAALKFMLQFLFWNAAKILRTQHRRRGYISRRARYLNLCWRSTYISRRRNYNSLNRSPECCGANYE